MGCCKGKWMDNNTPFSSPHGMDRKEGEKAFIASLLKLIKPKSYLEKENIYTKSIIEHYLIYILRSWIIQYGLLKNITNILNDKALDGFLHGIYQKIQNNLSKENFMAQLTLFDEINELEKHESRFFEKIECLEIENKRLKDAFWNEHAIDIEKFKCVKDMLGKYPTFNLTGAYNYENTAIKRQFYVEKDMEFLDIKRTYLSERIQLIQNDEVRFEIYPWVPSGGFFKSNTPLSSVFPESPWDDSAIYSNFSNHHIDDDIFFTYMKETEGGIKQKFNDAIFELRQLWDGDNEFVLEKLKDKWPFIADKERQRKEEFEKLQATRRKPLID